jgi:hypothetical protein
MAKEQIASLSRLRNRNDAESGAKAAAPKGVDEGNEAEEEGEGGAHEALEKMHEEEPESKHAIVSHDGYGMTSHHIDENGEHSGPHDHENIEELKSHLGKFFNEEEGEGKEKGDNDDHEDADEDSGNNLY